MKKVLVTGGSGMLGSAIPDSPNIVKASSWPYDLKNLVDAFEMFRKHRPTHVIHLAARVGGVKANTDFVADFFRDNILINTNILEAARVYKADKVLSILSSCIYPDDVELPICEDSLHQGPPHDSNYGYAYAKRMLDVQSRAYRQQYGCDFVTIVPNNLFGENDNFDLNAGHVIPAMIRKFHEAKLSESDVVLWGDGSPLRQFTYAKDLAALLLLLLDKHDNPFPINVGNSQEISIKQLAKVIQEVVGFGGKVFWDDSRPNGQLRKTTNFSKFEEMGLDYEFTDIKAAIGETYKWFEGQYPEVRGVS